MLICTLPISVRRSKQKWRWIQGIGVVRGGRGNRDGWVFHIKSVRRQMVKSFVIYDQTGSLAPQANEPNIIFPLVSVITETGWVLLCSAGCSKGQECTKNRPELIWNFANKCKIMSIKFVNFSRWPNFFCVLRPGINASLCEIWRLID